MPTLINIYRNELIRKLIDFNYIRIRLISEKLSVSPNNFLIKIPVLVLNIMYLKLKYNRTCYQSKIYAMSSRKKYRDIFTVALYKGLLIKKLSHENNSKLSSTTSVPFSPSKVCTTQHQIQSLSTLQLCYPVVSIVRILSFSLHFLIQICLHTPAPAIIPNAFYWSPKYLSGATGIPFHLLYLLLTG